MRTWQAWSLVVIQFALLALLVALPQGQLYPVGVVATAISGVLVALGVLVAVLAGARLGGSLTASPIPRSGGTLYTSGFYHYVRHPIYSALLAASLGLMFRGASLWHVLVFVALYGLLRVKARAEEAMLREKYESYLEYASRVGRFFPGLGRLSDN